MRLRSLSILLIVLATSGCLAQDENSEDVFDKPLSKDLPTTTSPSLPDDFPLAVPQEEMMNEGSDSFETSTEMIEISPNDTSLEVNPIQKTSVFSPITPLEGGVFNFSKATIEDDSMEDLDDSEELKTTPSENSSTDATTENTTPTLEVITFSSLPIERDEVADRRVLKEKEMATATRLATTTPTTVAVSDPSESVDEGETPFDQSALEGLFEQDGSVIDSSLTTDQTPAFPILKMAEEDSKILSNVPKSTVEVPTTTEVETTEGTSTGTSTSETEKIQETTLVATETTQSETETMPPTEPSTLLTESATETTSSEESSTTSSEDTTISEELSTISALKNSSKVFLPAKSIRTPLAFRIVSLEFTEEFNDIQSGPSKKLGKDLGPSIGEFINSISGEDNFVSMEIKTLTKGSVIVGAEILTKKSLGDAQLAVNLLEAAFSRNNSMISDYKIDSLSVTIDGMTSQAYIDSISTQTSSYSLSSLMIVLIVFALITIFCLAVFIIMITNKRRRQSTMKLSMDDTIRSSSPDSEDAPRNVHLMSYGTTPRTSQKPGPITKTQIDETASPMY